MRFVINDLIKYFPKRVQDSHKGTYGKVFNISGSKFYTGAAVLSSLSALKIGAGYVTLACPENICSIIASYSPDITFLPLENNEGCISHKNLDYVLKKSEEYTVVSIGSGVAQNTATQKFIIDFLKNIQKPCVIDADAINALSVTKDFILPEKSIITPHPRELSRLISVSVEEIQKNREKFAVETANKHKCIVILKGHNTVVTDGEKIYINETGNSALAKAGSGDVLTGIITGILAQKNGEDIFETASLGVYLHGFVADIAVKDTTEYGLLASELLNYIPKAVAKIIS